jgi:signal transduction histidine kinase
MSKPDKRHVPLSEYLPRVIHDLRNCLSVAVGTADLVLLDSTLNPALARDIEKIREACLRAMQIVDGPKPRA